jgi:hypothetical protein
MENYKPRGRNVLVLAHLAIAVRLGATSGLETAQSKPAGPSIEVCLLNRKTLRANMQDNQ